MPRRVALDLTEGTLHRSAPRGPSSPPRRVRRTYFTCTSPHSCTGDGNAMVLRAACRLQDMEFVQFTHRHLRRGMPITEGARVSGYLTNSKGERFMERYAPNAKDLASRDVVIRAMTVEIREGRGVGPEPRLHCSAPGAPGGRCHSRTSAGNRGDGAHIRRVESPREPIPVQPT